ncbi:hypothetical protein J6P92_03025 [bacterium]|nr:hypothetical protein [bacterium]
MQVDNNYNYNNYKNYKVNFGARKIMSATKALDDKFEKFEVYKLDYTDIPFVQKLAIYMKNQENKLNESQKKLYYRLKEFVTHQERYNVGEFSGDEKELYIGIKNDEQISGYMLLNNSRFRPYYYREYKIDEICPNTKDKVTEDTFIYSFFADKELDGHLRSILGTKFHKCSAFLTDTGKTTGARSHIRNKHPEYSFKTSEKEYFNLEDVLGITE